MESDLNIVLFGLFYRLGKERKNLLAVENYEYKETDSIYS